MSSVFVASKWILVLVRMMMIIIVVTVDSVVVIAAVKSQQESSPPKIIRVGDVTYEDPRTDNNNNRLPLSISQIVLELESIRENSSSSSPSPTGENDAIRNMVTLLVQLGWAHQELYNHQATNEATNHIPQQQQIRYSINAFHEAIRILLLPLQTEEQQTTTTSLSEEEEDDENEDSMPEFLFTIQSLLGEAYFGLAETLFLAQNDEDDHPHDGKHHHHHETPKESALEYYQKAHDIYFHLLFEGNYDDDESNEGGMSTSTTTLKNIDTYIPKPMNHYENSRDFYDLELRWAHASSRLGSLLMQQPASSQHLQQTLDEYYEKIFYSSSSTSIDPDMIAEITELFLGNHGGSKKNKKEDFAKTETTAAAETMQQLLQKLLGEQTTNALLDEMARTWQRLDRVEMYLYNAASVYQKALMRQPVRSPDRIETARSWAAALQNLGTVRLYKESPESFQRAADTYLQAIHVYETEIVSVFSEEEDDDDNIEGDHHRDDSSFHEQIDARMGMAESMFSLATAYLELGKYSDAKLWYQKCMNWNEQHGHDPAWDPSTMYATGFSSMIASEEEQIQQIEHALNEYHDLLMNGEADTIIMEEMEEAGMMEDYYYVEKSDAYEGDLHNKLGTLYLNRGDHVLASSHLQEAIRLYELDGEQDEINMASAKYNLSLLHLRAGEYQYSANLYNEALDAFKASVGEGLNPLSSDLDILDITNLVRKRATKKADDTESLHQSNKKPKNDGKQTTDQIVLKADPDGREEPKIFVDLENFLKQNDSVKEEL